jgi:hypothetical protein
MTKGWIAIRPMGCANYLGQPRSEPLVKPVLSGAEPLVKLGINFIEGPGTWPVQLCLYLPVYMDVKIPGDSFQGNLNTIHSINQFSSNAGEVIFTRFSSTIESGTKLFTARIRTIQAFWHYFC